MACGLTNEGHCGCSELVGDRANQQVDVGGCREVQLRSGATDVASRLTYEAQSDLPAAVGARATCELPPCASRGRDLRACEVGGRRALLAGFTLFRRRERI